MLQYVLSKDAEQDLNEVARYTLKNWGKKAFKQYRCGLESTFKTIASGKARSFIFSAKIPELMVTKYRYHYIFYIDENGSKPTIIGVIHERRDIVNQLTVRLN